MCNVCVSDSYFETYARHAEAPLPTFLTNPVSDSLVRAAGLKPADYGWLEVDVKPVVICISRNGPLGQNTAALHRLRTVCSNIAEAKPGSGLPFAHKIP